MTSDQFESPSHYPGSLWRGRILCIQEGSELVDHAEIIDIYEPILDGPILEND